MKNIDILNTANNDYLLEEAFNIIRTNILFSGFDTKVISITSCNSGDGKSTIAFEVARRLAAANKKVLFIDADMRKSILEARYTKEKGLPGLSHFLSGQAGIDEVLFATDTENLYMIFSGVYPPNPSELLINSRFSDFIKEAKENFDYVIIDTPPMGLVADASICISHSDGAILVLSCEKTSYRDAREAKKSLESTGTKIIGCILNRVNRNSKKYYYKF